MGIVEAAVVLDVEEHPRPTYTEHPSSDQCFKPVFEAFGNIGNCSWLYKSVSLRTGFPKPKSLRAQIMRTVNQTWSVISAADQRPVAMHPQS